MTVDTYSGGHSSSNPWGDFGDVGLEDVSSSDIRVPRLAIEHDNGTFKNTTTNEEFPELRAVFLGLVKQRIMWDPQIDAGDRPQCKSLDHEVGFPQLRTDIPARKQFPWSKSNFRQEDFPPAKDGLISLPCESCTFNQWGKDNERPPCSESYTFILYYQHPTSGVLSPATMAFSKSAIKAAKVYSGTFLAAKQPMFTVWTSMTLRPEARGKTRYMVPELTREGMTDAGEWRGWADAYLAMRDFMRARPRLADEIGDTATSTKPAPASATEATKLDDDDPWATAAPAASSSPTASTSSPADDDELPF
jgi:hypothetical protein